MALESKQQVLGRIAQLERELSAVRRELGEERRRAPLPSGTFQVLRVIVGRDEYAIPSDEVREVVRYAALTRVPGVSRAVEGALNLRGEIVLVLNVARRLGLGDGTLDLKTPIVVTNVHGRSVGLLVDRVVDVVDIDSSRVRAATGALTESRYVAGVVTIGDRMTQLIGLDELLSPSEIDALEARFSEVPLVDPFNGAAATDDWGDRVNAVSRRTVELDEAWMPAFLETVRTRFGQIVPERRLDVFRRSVIDAYVASGARSLEDYHALVAREPLDSPSVTELMCRITVKESYFFRDEFAMAALRDLVLPRLVAKNTATRCFSIWSAGCSNGEEPYTLSILLDTLLGGAPDFRVTVVGTDVDEAGLATARAARYGEWSVRSLTRDVRERYFEGRAGRFHLRERYKRRVRFETHNLADPAAPLPAPESFDLVLCRNVGIYLSDGALATLYSKLARALAPGGLVITAPSDPRPSPDSPLLPVLLRSEQSVTLGYTMTPAYWEPGSARRRSMEPAPSVESSRVPTIPAAPCSIVPVVDIPGPPATPRVPTPVPAAPAATEERAFALAEAGDRDGARAMMDRVIAARRLDPRVYVALSMLELEGGRHDAAEAALRKALYLDPHGAEAHYRLGLLCARRGNLGAARRALLNAVRCCEAAGDGSGLMAAIGAQLVDMERRQ